jgi:hypothetical protein
VEHRADAVRAEWKEVHVIKAYKYEIEVQPGGKVEVTTPIPPGSKVEVLVLAPEADEFADLLGAATSSTDFWDNPIDDAEWNHL